MAYPAFNSAPFVYGQNFHAEELRQHGTPNRVRFGAGSDGDATAIAGIFAGDVVSLGTSSAAALKLITLAVFSVAVFSKIVIVGMTSCAFCAVAAFVLIALKIYLLNYIVNFARLKTLFLPFALLNYKK